MSDDHGIPSAEDFARAAHDGQKYGGRPYAWHLESVVAVLAGAGFGADYQAAGWLHDVSEDVGVPIAALRSRFGDRVADLVKACTGVGRNRKERNACIYERIARCPDAAIVKVADRIANVEAAAQGSSHAEMYLKEATSFHDHVARFAPEALRLRLNRAYTAKGLASAIEAATAGETGTGSTEGESAVAKPDAQKPSRDTREGEE
jgi:(p)ppGpp synthase/HD superfamily hydrolase